MTIRIIKKDLASLHSNSSEGVQGTLVPRPWCGVSPIGINLRATPFPKGCRVLPAGVWDVPKYLFLFSRRLRRREKRKEIFKGRPLYPAKGRLPLGTPLKLTPYGGVPHRRQLKGNTPP